MNDKTFDLNAISLLRIGLEKTIRPLIVEQIMDNMVTEFKEKIRPTIVAEANKVCLKSLEQFRDMMKMRDELRLVIKIEE